MEVNIREAIDAQAVASVLNSILERQWLTNTVG